MPPHTPSIEDAYNMGATGGKVSDDERLAFEAWMKGHCWAIHAKWRNGQYISDQEIENKNYVCPHAMSVRQLWAAWRDRAALAQQSSNTN